MEAVGDGLDVLDEEMVLVREEDAAEDEDGVAVVGEGWAWASDSDPIECITDVGEGLSVGVYVF